MQRPKKFKASGRVTSPWIRDTSGFWHGFGGVFNFIGGDDNSFDTTTPWWVRDAEAIRQDWEKVGDDFRRALAMPVKGLHEK